jgi:hypothetical protein
MHDFESGSPRRRYTARLSDADQIGDRGYFHLFHDAAAMNFDGSLGGSEFGGDLFVQQPGDDALQHFKFAGRERLQTGARGGMTSPGRPHIDRTRQCLAHRDEQWLFLNRLGEKIDRTGFHGLGAYRHVAMAGQKNDLFLTMEESLL